MQSFFFWKHWPKDYRWIWYALMILFLAALIFMWASYFKGAHAIINWEKLQEQKLLESVIHTYKVGPFELDIPGENYVILEYFNGSEIIPNVRAAYIFVVVLILCAILLVTVITTLDRFWFLAGMGLFILFIVSLRLEVLNILGQRNQIPAIVLLVVYISTGYFFNAIRPTTAFILRLASFFVLTVLAGLIIYFFTNVQYPFLHLNVTGYLPALILSVLFIFMIAHEILASFIFIISQGKSRSLRHFMIISIIYLGNILITCLHEIEVIQWNFVYINLYLLFSISALLGIWGFRNREPLYGNIIQFAPFGAFFIAALGTICLISTGRLLGTHNDAALRIIRDAIIFSHTGYGIIFLTYVFSNFVLMMAQNIPVHRVLFKPNRMPYFTYRLAGLIAVLAFVFYSNWREYVYNGMAGFYNELADLYLTLDESAIAEAYYEQGRNYGFRNNHSNYALGSMKSSRFDFGGALYNYELANGKRPTEFSLINEGNLSLWQNNVFEGIHKFRKALQIVPNSGAILNNLGFAYGKVHALDSAMILLSDAEEYKLSRQSAETNFFALTALEHVPIHADSILNSFNTSNPATISNALALATIQKQEFNVEFNPFDSGELDLYTATLLNNYIVRNTKTLDTVFIRKAYQIASDSLNEDFSEALKSSLASVYYHHSNVRRALEMNAELAYISQSYQGKHNYIMGLWALEQGNPELAASYFRYAVQYDYKKAQLYHAIALTEDGQHADALIAWDSVATSGDEVEQDMAAQVKNILNLPDENAKSLADPEKYQYCRYRLHVMDTVSFDRLINTFENANYKAKALLDMTQRQFEWSNLKTAIRYFNQIGGLELTDRNLYEDIRHTELLLLAERRELRKLAEQINDNISFGPQRFLEKTLYTALINEASNDTVNAEKNYEILANYNPYFEEGIIAASQYFRAHSNDELKAYTILAEAMQTNNASPKLIHAYAREAIRVGFDHYAVSALQRLEELIVKRQRIRQN